MIGNNGNDPEKAENCLLWLFRKTSSVQDVYVLLQAMNGKTLAPAPKAKAKAKAKAKSGKGKSKGQTHQSEQSENPMAMVEDPAMLSEHVSVEVDGHQVTRTKYFVDCLIGGVRSALLTARQKHGVPHGSTAVEPSSVLGKLPIKGGTAGTMEDAVYYEYEVPILRKCFRLGIVFAIQGQLILDRKRHTRWSTCRPQIQKIAMQMVEAVACF